MMITRITTTSGTIYTIAGDYFTREATDRHPNVVEERILTISPIKVGNPFRVVLDTSDEYPEGLAFDTSDVIEITLHPTNHA